MSSIPGTFGGFVGSFVSEGEAAQRKKKLMETKNEKTSTTLIKLLLISIATCSIGIVVSIGL